jgi:hypothetical protein
MFRGGRAIQWLILFSSLVRSALPKVLNRLQIRHPVIRIPQLKVPAQVFLKSL